MKIALDLISLTLFFLTYKLYDIFYATGVMMTTYTLVFIYSYISTKKLDKTILATWILVIALGGLTLGLHNATFIKYKPTVVYWVFAIAFHVSPYLKDEKSIMERMAGHTIKLPVEIWNNLNKLWTAFFYLLGSINIYVAYYYTEEQWVNFKTFGCLALLLVIAVIQAVYMAKYIEQEPNDEKVTKDNIK